MPSSNASPDVRGTADSHVHSYRPDIDGLRAIAVLSVVLFHIEKALLPGGYLGVDIFFVISGFLITGIIRREQTLGRFSLRTFYERRIRRIMPALLFVLTLTTVASIALLLPGDLIGYGKSLVATLGFVANVYFFLDTNYFAAAAELKPLLHMWSLGVEEQFYLFFPLILMALARFPRAVLPAVALLTLTSFLGNVFALYVNKSNPAFFLIPFRAWELGFGALLALVMQDAPRSRPRPIAALIGLVLVVIALLRINPLAGLSVPIALLAVAGTTLLIWSHHGGLSPIGRMLASRPAVSIGLISYSLYLWHWPLLVLPRYYLVRDMSPMEAGAAAAAAGALAVVSLHVIEKPFRQKSMPVRRVYGLTAAVSVLALVAGVAVVLKQGLPSRLSPEAAAINAAVGTNYRCPATSYLSFGALYACPLALPSGRPADADTVLFGNSHAQMYAPAVEKALATAGRQGLLVPANSCLPTVGVNISRDCARTMETNLDAVVALPNARTVIVAFSWHLGRAKLVDSQGRPLAGERLANVLDGLERTVDALNAAGKAVVVVGPIARPGYDMASEVSRKLAFGHDVEDAYSVALDTAIGPHRAALDVLSARDDVTLLLPHEIQCHGGRCWFIDDGIALFSDSNHFGRDALDRFVPMFERALVDH